MRADALATVQKVSYIERREDAAGQGLPMIGKLLGHTQVATTARYAHLAADPVKATTDHVSAAIAASVLG